MAFCRSAILSLLVLTAILQLSVCLLKEIKGLRGSGNDVRMEEDVPVKDILKKFPTVRVSVGTRSGYVSRICC